MKRRSRLLACQSHKANWEKRYFSEKKHDKNLLVELGLEELPAYVSHQVKNNSAKKWQPSWMTTAFHMKEFKTFSTPRRLAVRVLGLADQQTDLT